jgi:hypothetical protein
MSHRHTHIHKTHHNPDLGEAITFCLIVFSMLGHGACTQMSFCHGTFNFPKLGFSWLWRPTNFYVDLRLKWGLKWSYSLCWDIFKDMWHTTYKKINQNDSPLLMVESQIANLTHDPSFGHNLCFEYPNGSWKPISDICVSRSLQWYKKIFNPMSFIPCNHLLKIWEFIETPTPKEGAHLGVSGFIPSYFPIVPGAWNVIPRFHSWLTPLQTFTLVANPSLGLWHSLK